jgi:hypothetical protein
MTLQQFLAAPIHTRDQVYRPPAGGGTPQTPGTYGAWGAIEHLPPIIDITGCPQVAGHALIYAGQTGDLRDRIQQHYRINSDGSSLRIRLGIALGLDLRLISSASGFRNRYSFLKSSGEAKLTGWMADNVRFSWLPNPNPAALETLVIAATNPPFNEPFTPALSNLISAADTAARARGPIPDC